MKSLGADRHLRTRTVRNARPRWTANAEPSNHSCKRLDAGGYWVLGSLAPLGPGNDADVRDQRNTSRRIQRRSDGRETHANRDSTVILYGWHTVKAALENPRRRIRRLFATENAARRLADAGVLLRVELEPVRPEMIARRLSPDAVHNGVLAEADPLPSPELDETEAVDLMLVLDQITDPHNVGAILRTAAAFDVGGVVTTARHSPQASGVLAKSASGALEYVPLIAVQNLARAIEELRERGFLVIGLDSSGADDLTGTAVRAPLALILGAEGKGLRQLTRTSCDGLARLDLPGRIKSLNVSNAAALALYIARKRLVAGI
jgi:23S rRNA (guanosine2251-2'-O)-methyltransferase